jgi:acetolactate synthase-1/2/3 large subunit
MAKKPILYVGQGSADHYELVRILAKKANIPVTTTLHGLGIFDETDPLSLHMVGMHGSVYANYAIQNADLILCVGARFNDRTTGDTSKYAPEARRAEKLGKGGIIHFDTDNDQIGKTIRPTMSLVGDCGYYLEELVKHVYYQEREPWINKLNKWKEKHPFSYIVDRDNSLTTQMVIDKLHKYIENHCDTNNVILTTGVGNHQMMTAQFYRHRHPNSLLSSGSLGTMGVGVPFAMGAHIANPGKTVICIDGDGSFNMTLQELGTVVEHNIPIKIAIMNDSRQQMVWVWQKLFFDRKFISTSNKNPDYVELAKSFGIKAIRCVKKSDLEKTFKYFLETREPIVCDFRVNPDICLPLVAPGKGLDEMIKFGEHNINSSMHMDGVVPS